MYRPTTVLMRERERSRHKNTDGMAFYQFLAFQYQNVKKILIKIGFPWHEFPQSI